MGIRKRYEVHCSQCMDWKSLGGNAHNEAAQIARSKFGYACIDNKWLCKSCNAERRKASKYISDRYAYVEELRVKHV